MRASLANKLSAGPFDHLCSRVQDVSAGAMLNVSKSYWVSVDSVM